MEFILLQSFPNYMEAHIMMGRLEEEGIRCWLKDENTVTINPIWTHAVGGIKLMVAAEQFERASAILQEFNEARRATFTCPNCGSSEIEYITSPRKFSNWLGALGGFIFGDLAMGVDKTWRCFQCNAEFETPNEKKDPEDE